MMWDTEAEKHMIRMQRLTLLAAWLARSRLVAPHLFVTLWSEAWQKIGASARRRGRKMWKGNPQTWRKAHRNQMDPPKERQHNNRDWFQLVRHLYDMSQRMSRFDARRVGFSFAGAPSWVRGVFGAICISDSVFLLGFVAHAQIWKPESSGSSVAAGTGVPVFTFTESALRTLSHCLIMLV